MEKAKSAKERTSRLEGEDVAAAFSFLRVAVWLAVLPLAYFFGWINSVAFVALASIYANLASDYAAWRADRNKKLWNEMNELHKKLDILLGQRRGS